MATVYHLKAAKAGLQRVRRAHRAHRARSIYYHLKTGATVYHLKGAKAGLQRARRARTIDYHLKGAKAGLQRARGAHRARIIDYRLKIGSEAWKKQPRKARRLSLWRRAHMFGGHGPVSSHAKKLGYSSSKSLSMGQLRSFISQHEGGK